MVFMGILAGIITAVLMYKVIFSGKDDFFECIRFWLIPDIFSMIRGQYWDDHWAQLKLFIWLGASVAAGYSVYNI